MEVCLPERGSVSPWCPSWFRGQERLPARLASQDRLEWEGRGAALLAREQYRTCTDAGGT